MKKHFILLFVSMLLVCSLLCACSGNNETNTAQNDNVSNETSVSAEEDTAEGSSEADSGNRQIFGTWAATEESSSSGTFTVEEMESNSLYSLSDWLLIVSENGRVYFQSSNRSAEFDNAEVDEKGITAGNNRWNLIGGRLVIDTGDSSTSFEKISEDQTFPDIAKDDILKMLQGTWDINSSERTGYFSFSDTTCTAEINGLIFEESDVYIDTKNQQILTSTQSGDTLITMNLDYSYDNGVLSLSYSGDSLTKE